VSNSKIEFSELSRQNSIIVHNAASDIILSPADKSIVSNDAEVSNMVAYETRPLILVFWLGGTLILFGVFGAIVRTIYFHYNF
jgi:hypothetical protein